MATGKIGILVVGQGKRISQLLWRRFANEGYRVVTATNGVRAISRLNPKGAKDGEASRIGLVITEITMAEMDGFDLLKELRGFSQVPVIVLSKRDTIPDRIKGLSLGADDYMGNPFNLDELAGRVAAVLRRVGTPTVWGKFIGPNCALNLATGAFTVRGKEVTLSPNDRRLLSELIRHPDRVVTYQELLAVVRGSEYRGDTALPRKWISRLGEKLEKLGIPSLIRTVKGEGCSLDVQVWQGLFPDQTGAP